MESWILSGIAAAALLFYAVAGKGAIFGRAVCLFAGLFLGMFALQSAMASPTAWVIITVVALLAITIMVLKQRAKKRKQREDERRNSGNTNNFFFNHHP